MEIYIVIGCVFFGILSGIIANNKNRCVGAWVMLGIIFGIFAFGIILALPKVEEIQD